MAGEFKEFLEEYKIIGLAIAFIIGVAAAALVKSLVDNIVMPPITPFIPDGAWREAVLAIGPFLFGWGALLGEAINFLMIAIAVFIIAKFLLKEQKVAKK